MRAAVALAAVVLALVALIATACDRRARACDDLDAKACTEDRRCILDRGDAAGRVACRAAVGCELVVHAGDLDGITHAGDAWHREFVARCEARPDCRYDDRGCFCPCNLPGFPACSCACGGGLPPRCAPK